MKKNSVVIVIALTLTLIVGVFVGQQFTFTSKIEKKPLYWIDTMEPTIHYVEPGKSRMGMELVPVYPEQGEDQSSVHS